MKLKFAIFFTMAVILSGYVSAKSVDESTACTVASHFFAMKFNHSPESLTPTIAYAAPTLRGEKGAPSFYVVNFNSEGFVIVAGDDRVQPILAFPMKVSLSQKTCPTTFAFSWMDIPKKSSI